MTGAETMRAARDESLGYLSAVQLAAIAADPATRLVNVLVRFHEGRCLVPADQAKGLIEAAGRGGWSVRDVSLPATSGGAR